MTLGVRQKRILALLTGLIALLLAADWFEHRFLDPKRYRKRIVQTLEHLTGLPVRVGDIRVTPLSGFTVRVEHVEILSPDPRDPPFLSVEEAEFRLGISLFADRQEPWRLTSLHLRRPHLNWIRNAPYPFLGKKQARGKQTLLFPRGELSIQKGIATYLDRTAAVTWIVDQWQLSTRFQGNRGATPFSTSALLQGVPVTLAGAVGPPPTDGDPTAWPLLLNVSVKTDDPSPWLAQLHPGESPFKLARGHLSLLLQGTLREGLQTTLNLELAKLQATSPDPKAPAWNLTVRNKSLLLTRGGRVSLEMTEGFVDLDRTPTLEFKGLLALNPELELDATLATLAPLPLVSLPGIGERAAGKIEGGMRLKKSGDAPMQLFPRLDLTAARLDLPWNLAKREGEPLFLDGELLLAGSTLSVAEASIVPGPGEKVLCRGALSPDPQLTLSGRLQAERLPRYFRLPGGAWPLHGNLDLELTLTGRQGEPELAGRIAAEQVLLGPWDWRQARAYLVAARERFTLTAVSASLWDGLMEGDLLLVPGEGGFGRAGFTLAGVSTEKLLAALFPGKPPPLSARGPLSAQGSLEGFLGSGDTPLTLPLGRISAWIPGGRLEGITLADLTRRPDSPLTLSPDKGLDFTYLGADFQWAGEGVLLEALQLTHPLATITGQGRKRPGAPLELSLDTRPVWPEGRVHSFSLQGDGREMRLSSATGSHADGKTP